MATPASGDLLPVLDLERSNGLTPAALTDWVREFLDRVYQRTGVRGVIYCSPSFWKNYMGDTGWFASNGYTILWVAHWTTASSPTRARGQLGRQGLDVLAVHLGWHRARDLRPRRPRPLQRHRPHEGPAPLADRAGSGSSASPSRRPPATVRHENARRNQRSLAVPTRCKQRVRSRDVRGSFEHVQCIGSSAAAYLRCVDDLSGVSQPRDRDGSGDQAASPSAASTGSPTSIGLLIGSWLHSNQPPSYTAIRCQPWR